MAVKFSNNFSTVLVSSISSSATVIELQSVSGLPTLAAGDHTYLTFDTDTNSPTIEIVKVTAINTGTNEVTVVRGQDNTSASAFAAGTAVELRMCAILLSEFLQQDGDGSNLTDVRAETVEVNVKNVSGGSLAKGTPVHQTGTSGAATFEVVAADASNASVMPAHFVLLETLADQAEGRGLLMGRISGVDTSSFSEGDTIYVAVGGGYTNSAPTGEGNLIQNLGTVTRVDATNGGGEVMGAGRANATPNLNEGNIFLGNASNQAATASLSTSVSSLSHYNNANWDTAYGWGDHASAGYQAASTALTTSTTFGGDVSGTYNAIVVADDSHNHIISNVDGLQSALDDLTPTSNDTFSGTYSLVWVANDVLYSSTFMTINGATDTLSVPNVSTGTVTVESTAPYLVLSETDQTDLNAYIGNSAGKFSIRTISDDLGTLTKRLEVDHSTGDISFYNTSGTAKLLWDASDSRLGVGTTSPDYTLHAYHPTTNVVARFESGDSNIWIDLHDSNSGSFGALLGHDSTNLFKVADSSVAIKMALSPSGLLDTDAGYSVLGNTVIDSSRNATLGTISSGAISATSVSVTNIVTNKVVKFNGSILDDSNITDTGSAITLGSNTTVSGTISSGAITSTGTSTFAGIRLNNSNTSISQGSGNALRIQTNSGYVDVGPKNTSWAHFDTDRGKFYFGQDVHVNGQLYFYDAGTTNTPYWHAGNDGSGSSLDADLLDGYHETSFVRTSTGVSSNLDSDYRAGMTGYSPSTSGTKPDTGYGQIINIVSSGSSHNNSNNWITQLAFGTGQNTSWFRSKTNSGAWGAWRTIWNDSNDGSGSGLDADLLDGIDSSSFLRSDAADDFSGSYLEFQDNSVLRFGNGADYRIWHDGASGDTYFRNYGLSGSTYFMGEDSAGTNHAMIYLRGDTSAPYVQLFYDGNEVLRTSSGGVTITNNITSGGINTDSTKVVLGGSSFSNMSNAVSVAIGSAWISSSASLFVNGFSRYNGPLYISDGGATNYVGIGYDNGKITALSGAGAGLNAFDAPDGYYVGNVNVINSARRGFFDRVYVGAGENDGFFYSDTNGRTAFASGDFYIQDTVGNFYNYATNQYYGAASGDNIYFRGNTLAGDGWNLDGSGNLNVAADYVRLFNYTHGTVPTTVGIVSIHSGGKTGWAPGDELGRLRWYANDTSGNWPAEVAAIKAVNRSGNGSTTTVGSAALEFYTSPYNVASASLALRLDLDQTADFQNDIKMGGTTVIDSSRNLTNIGDASLAGELVVNSANTAAKYLWINKGSGDGGILWRLSNALKFQNVLSGNDLAWYSYELASTAFVMYGSGEFTAKNGYQVNGTTVIDSSRNLTNIGQITADDVRVTAGDGEGYGFWSSALGGSYRIYMSSASNSTYGGRVTGETTSDYNMYFKMQSGTNRGFVFRDDADNFFSINPNGVYSEVPIYLDGLWLRNSPDRPGLLDVYQTGTGWMGYQISNNLGEHWSFMGNDGAMGLYDDQNNKWAFLYYENAYASLYFNGSEKLRTASDGIKVYSSIEATSTATAFPALNLGNTAQTQYTNIVLNSDYGSGQIWKTGSAYTSWGGAHSFNIYSSQGDICIHPAGNANVLKITSGGIAAGRRIDAAQGMHGGYSTTSGTGSAWGACIWSIGASWAGSGTGTSYSIGDYGLHWLRSAHADEIAYADEGLYLTRASTTPYAALGRSGAYFATRLASTGDITAYYSDERLKQKTGVIENALDKVRSLEGFTYVENELARELGYNNTKEQVGVSAQAVQRVLPQAVSLAPVDFGDRVDGEIVSKSGEDYLTVDYSRLVPLLVESIKELSTEVERLKKLLEKDNGND